MEAVRLLISTLRVLDRAYGLKVCELRLWHEEMLGGPSVPPIRVDSQQLEQLHRLAWSKADNIVIPHPPTGIDDVLP